MNDAASTEARLQSSFWTFVTQGATVGMVLSYTGLVIGLETTDPYFHFLIVAAVPQFLAMGLAFGAVKGMVIWACTKLVRHRLGWFLRSAIAAVVLEILIRALSLVYPSNPNPDLQSLIWRIGYTVVAGLTYGLVIGSRLQPWRALVRGGGTIGPKSATLAGVTGGVLRLAVLFFFLVFLLVFLSVLQMNSQRREFTWILLIAIHFTLSLLAVFNK